MIKANDQDFAAALAFDQTSPFILVYRSSTRPDFQDWKKTDPIVEAFMQYQPPPVLAVDAEKIKVWAPYIGLLYVPGLAMLGNRDAQGNRPVIRRWEGPFTAYELDRFAGRVSSFDPVPTGTVTPKPAAEKSDDALPLLAVGGALLWWWLS